MHVGIELPDGAGHSRIVLIGMMGSGKTTLARRWARVHPGPALWFDSDRAALIELGCETVTEAVARHGLDGWRATERTVITRRSNAVVRGVEVWSLGGGSVQDADVQRALLDADAVVWLDAPTDVLWERVSGSDRPLATDHQAFADLHAARSKLYASLATVQVSTDMPVDDIELPRDVAGSIDIDAMCSGLVIGRHAARLIPELSALVGRDVVVVGDAAIAAELHAIATSVHAGGATVLDTFMLPGGEWHKQLSTVESLIERWAAVGVHRRCVVIAVGGGTVLDTVGFAASIHARGLTWVSVPTTVLAQVDAGIGGKTGVNRGHLKNVIGTIHLPRNTVIDVALLRTLPDELVADGWVEAAKTGLLGGPDAFAQAERVPLRIDDDPGAWLALIDQCAAFKDAVVSEDPTDETGIRAQLNLGHTVAHAIEAATAGGVSHGRAVAIGIHFALQLSVALLDCAPDLVSRWVSACEERGLPTRSPLTWDEIATYIGHDKKRTERGIGWVLLASPGDPVTEVIVPPDQTRDIWESHLHAADVPAADLTNTAPVRARPRVLFLCGINLGQLGVREPEQYGTETLADLAARAVSAGTARGVDVECRQTDSLERFVGALHEARTAFDAVIVNPGAWTHHERAIHDAVAPIPGPVVEFHLSDVMTREEWRHVSVLDGVVADVVSGQGADGIDAALDAVIGALTRTESAPTGGSRGSSR